MPVKHVAQRDTAPAIQTLDRVLEAFLKRVFADESALASLSLPGEHGNFKVSLDGHGDTPIYRCSVENQSAHAHFIEDICHISDQYYGSKLESVQVEFWDTIAYLDLGSIIIDVDMVNLLPATTRAWHDILSTALRHPGYSRSDWVAKQLGAVEIRHRYKDAVMKVSDYDSYAVTISAGKHAELDAIVDFIRKYVKSVTKHQDSDGLLDQLGIYVSSINTGFEQVQFSGRSVLGYTGSYPYVNEMRNVLKLIPQGPYRIIETIHAPSPRSVVFWYTTPEMLEFSFRHGDMNAQ